MEFATRVSGIPCFCSVLSYIPVIPAYTEGPPENCHPEEGGKFEYELLDRKGYRAKWLEKKIKPEDDNRLYKEFKLKCRAEEFNNQD